MRKFLGELKLVKENCDTDKVADDKIADILRDKGYIVVFTEETKVTKTYNILSDEEINYTKMLHTDKEDK